MTDELAGKTTTRPDMVAAARRFMVTPKVKETPYEEQKQFLLGKGKSSSKILKFVYVGFEFFEKLEMINDQWIQRLQTRRYEILYLHFLQ